MEEIKKRKIGIKKGMDSIVHSLFMFIDHRYCRNQSPVQNHHLDYQRQHLIDQNYQSRNSTKLVDHQTDYQQKCLNVILIHYFDQLNQRFFLVIDQF